MTKKLLQLAAAIALTLPGAGRAQVKIGFINSITGPEAPIGENLTNGVDMAVEDLKKKGVNVTVVKQDDTGKPQIAMSSLETLEGEQVAALVGPYTSANANAVAKLAEHGWQEDGHVVFTAHSLPERILADGDPYRDQLLETARLAASRAGLPDDRWSFAFQSESPTGEPWLGPDILARLDDLHAAGVRRVLVAPVGFVADHLEILWDLDVEARQRAGELGLELDRIVSMNDDPAFVLALADLVRKELAA